MYNKHAPWPVCYCASVCNWQVGDPPDDCATGIEASDSKARWATPAVLGLRTRRPASSGRQRVLSAGEPHFGNNAIVRDEAAPGRLVRADADQHRRVGLRIVFAQRSEICAAGLLRNRREAGPHGDVGIDAVSMGCCGDESDGVAAACSNLVRIDNTAPTTPVGSTASLQGQSRSVEVSGGVLPTRVNHAGITKG